MLTMKRPKAKQAADDRNPMEAWNEKIRLAEQALLRLDDGVAEPGDVPRVAEVGWSDPAEQKRQIERLRGVRIFLERVGTSQELQASRDTYHETEPRVRAAIAIIDEESDKLRTRLAELNDHRGELVAELKQAEDDLKVRTTNLEKLRSPSVVPPHIAQELNARTRSVNAASLPRQRELSEMIANLKADGARLKNQTEASGYISSEGQLGEYAARAARTESHRAHMFWRDRVFSNAEWGNFDSWCQSRASEAQVELASIRAGVQAELADEQERLLGFYSDAIE